MAAAFERGWQVVGIDRNSDVLEQASRQVPQAHIVEWDVEQNGLPDLGGDFDLVTTTFFLYRPLLPALFSVLRPGGQWLIETFHTRNHIERGHPRRRHFCLGPNEAGKLAKAAGFEVVWANEGEHGGLWTTQMLAMRPG